jgi:hypothetical protein
MGKKELPSVALFAQEKLPFFTAGFSFQSGLGLFQFNYVFYFKFVLIHYNIFLLLQFNLVHENHTRNTFSIQ